MTARRRSRRTRNQSVLLAAGLALAVIIGLDVAHALWLLVVGGLAAVAYVIARDRRSAGRRTGPAPVRPVIQPATWADTRTRTAGPVLHGSLPQAPHEASQLAADAADLRRCHAIQLQAAADVESALRRQHAAELADLRRQVAKLEDDAARHDQLLEDLEDAAGRPVEAIIATYRHVQRQYGPATVGKAGGRR